MNSLSLIFSQVYESELLTGYNIFSFLVHILEMIVKLLIKHNYEEKKKKYLSENIQSYLYSDDLIADIMVFLGFLGFFAFRLTPSFDWRIVCNILIIMKIRTLLMTLGHIELVLI